MKSQLLLKVNNIEEAKEILEKAYKMDSSSAYFKGGKAVNGHFISAMWDGKNQVTIVSEYYSQCSLNEAFSTFSCF